MLVYVWSQATDINTSVIWNSACSHLCFPGHGSQSEGQVPLISEMAEAMAPYPETITAPDPWLRALWLPSPWGCTLEVRKLLKVAVIPNR